MLASVILQRAEEVFPSLKESLVSVLYRKLMGATAVLVLQDGRQRNSHPIQVVFRDFRGTEMRMYRVAIVRVE